ncbi:hypothetical protein F2Q70_00035651 [Brassica cretica]|uniref:Agenet-like domain-containing protein n=1 Tax=Brassica cretica TaxID=69181 RepID=A0A8S9JZT6_BRACR|nr:hypothetical protein F2Q68_00030859 [Brassica cretica]KAF2587461.1 hypothetical protein F2Q70_00035651 [Brassica cretica]
MEMWRWAKHPLRMKIKLNRVSEMMEENFKTMDSRLPLIEKNKENKELKARVSVLEKRQRVTSNETLEDETDTKPLDNTPSKHGEANPNQTNETLDIEPLTVETRVPSLFEMGANVEIESKDYTTCRKWYQGNVLKTYLLDGLEMVTVEYSSLFLDQENKKHRVQKSVSRDIIRPQPPLDEQIYGETKKIELMDNVEVYQNDGWCSGRVHIMSIDDIFCLS